jgi:hypothetical protein
VRDRKTDLFGHVQGGQQDAFLVAGGTRAALLAGKGHEHLVLAFRQRTRAKPSCLAGVFLGLVDNFSSIGYIDPLRQAERAADDILHQTLDTRPVTCGQ